MVLFKENNIFGKESDFINGGLVNLFVIMTG